MPVFNEAGVIEQLLAEVEADVASSFEAAETIVVDDASTDRTAEILDGLVGTHPGLRVERQSVNAGHGPSVRHGLDIARGEWIFQLDSDRQTVTSDFWALWERRHDADLVLGLRVDRNDPRHRLLLSRLVRAVVTLLVGRTVRDANVPFRLIRSAVWRDLRPLVGERPLVPSILVTTGAALRGWRVVEVPISHRPRERGRSSLRHLRLLVFSLRGLVELIAFRLRLLRAGRR